MVGVFQFPTLIGRYVEFITLIQKNNDSRSCDLQKKLKRKTFKDKNIKNILISQIVFKEKGDHIVLDNFLKKSNFKDLMVFEKMLLKYLL